MIPKSGHRFSDKIMPKPKESCIRASAIDSFSWRYRTIVPEDCVGDIEEQPHRDNLRDIGRRYVDVTDLAFCVDYLERWGKRNSA